VIRIIICGRDEKHLLKRCFDSVKMQRHGDSIVYVSLDSDKNRKYLVRNTWELIAEKNIPDEDILVFLDADDFLCDEDALKIITDTYEKYPGCLLTYGSYANYSSGKRGKFTGPYSPEESVRHSPWRASHLKTCKSKLWKCLPERCLKWPDGSWFKCAADRAFMIPLMEMAGWDRCQYIDWLLYCYNDENPESVWDTMRDESIRTREQIFVMPPLQRLETV
jgi:hypothetical protein